jgi:seryl-tRNA synthetase
MALADALKKASEEKQETETQGQTGAALTSGKAEETELTALLRESRELNRLMQGYISVHMKEGAQTGVNLTEELKKIRSQSEEIQNRQLSILKLFGETSKDYEERQARLLNETRTDWLNQIRGVAERQKEIEADLRETIRLTGQTVKSEVGSAMDEMRNAMRGFHDEHIRETSRFHKDFVVYYWLDMAKYSLGSGLVSAIFFLLILRFVLGARW